MTRRIGLLTLPLYTNYGGIIQAVALYQYLMSIGKDVVLLERGPYKSPQYHAAMLMATKLAPNRLLASPAIDHGRTTASGRESWMVRRLDSALRAIKFNKRKAVHRPFIEGHIPKRTGPLTTSAALAEAVERFDLEGLVVGSDQVWRMRYQPTDAVADYFLGFCPDRKIRRVAYAASFGVGKWEHPQHTQTARELLKNFNAISLREDSGVEILQSEFGRYDAEHVLDPTLLVDPAFYEAIAAPSPPKVGGVILEYLLDSPPGLERFRTNLKKTLGSDHVVRSLVLDSGVNPIDVPSWIRAFMDADFVITDSYHGTIFSIIFRKNFISIVNKDRGAERFSSLLSMLELNDRMIEGENFDTANYLYEKQINYENVYSIIHALRSKSAEFIYKALD